MYDGAVLKPRVKVGRNPSDCWEWLGPRTEGGYGKKQYCSKTELAHRWLWVQLFGPIPDGKVINHKCQNRGCVNPHHLEVASQAENVRLSDSTILTPGDVAEIKAAKAARKPGDAKRLAAMYGCSRQLIHDIWNGRAWAPAKPFYGPKQEAASA